MKRQVALIILYDEEGRLLLQHRTSDAALMPDYWAFFGGGIKPGETVEDALIRESMEELNYRPKAPALVAERDFKVGKVEGRVHVYIDSVGDKKSSLRLQEGQGWGWYKVPETEGLKMIEHDRELLRYVAGQVEERLNNARG